MFYRYEHSISISPISHMAIFVYMATQHFDSPKYFKVFREISKILFYIWNTKIIILASVELADLVWFDFFF